MKDIFETIEPDDLSPDLRLICDAMGIVVVRDMMRNLGGLSIYVPKITRLDSFIDKYVLNNSSKNYKQLAVELGVSEQYLRNKYRHKNCANK